MHDKPYKRSIFSFLGILLLTLSVFSVPYVQAQDVQQLDPADYKKWKEDFVPYDLGELAFSKDKSGCSKKMAFFNVLIKRHKEGVLADEITDSRVIGPYIQEQYDTIRTKGVERATHDSMTEYQACMQNAQAHKDPSREYDMQQRYGACDQLNTIVLDTLKAIKNRRNIDVVLKEYQNNIPDLSETSYASMEDPVPLLVGKLYQKAQSSDYADVVELGSGITYACYM